MQVTTCRVCAHADLDLFLDLGTTALANAFVRPENLTQPALRFPLRLVLCARCGLVQLDEVVPADMLFRDYIYVSGTSDLVKTHAAALVQQLVSTYALRPSDLVVEAGSNDGTILRVCQAYQLRTVGIDPAENIATRANANGLETVCAFFNTATAQAIRAQYGPAKVFLARHVLAHVADLHDFVQGMALALAPDGIAVVEVPHLLAFHDALEYDTVYHEHLSYFSVRVLEYLFECCGLEVIDVQAVAIHGGSIVVTAQLRDGPWPVQATVAQMLDHEAESRLHQLATWQQFTARVVQSKQLLVATLDELLEKGRRIAGYGAPAKGMTLLAYCGIGPERVSYLVDKSPFKQGLCTPGQHIPIFAPEKLLQDQPEVVLVLAWNFAAEIARQQAEYLRRGGSLLLPIPQAQYW